MALYRSEEDPNKNVRGELVDSSTVSYHSDVGYVQQPIVDIEGNDWVTYAYYNQIAHVDSRVGPLDLSAPITKQPYKKVIDFQLSITENPTYERNENQEDFLTGVALFHPNTVIPQIGDMFVAAYDGRKMIWYISGESIRVKPNYMSRVYEADFKFYSSDMGLVEHLDQRTVQTLTFSQDLLEQGKDPILTTKQTNTLIGHGELLASVIHRLYRNFIDPRLNTFILRSGRHTVYDPFAVDFFNKTIGRNNLFGYRYPHEYSVGFKYENCGLPTFWEAILAKDPKWLLNAPRYFNPESPAADKLQKAVYSIRRIGISKLCAPREWYREADSETEYPYVGSEALWTLTEAEYDEDDRLLVKALKGHSWAPEEFNWFYEKYKDDRTELGFRYLILMAALLGSKIDGR